MPGRGVRCGPGRGSGAGSLVAYALKITDLDPLEYNLLFERFLNPERVSMPDFDIDFCQDNRWRVIEYVREHYGSQAVSQIATFGTMSSKAVIRDVGRVFGMPYSMCDRISKLIPIVQNKPVSLAEALTLLCRKIAVATKTGDLVATAQWPDVIGKTSADRLAEAQALSQASGGGAILSQESAVKLAAAVFGVEDPDEEVRRVQAAAEEAMAAARAAVDATRAAVGTPGEKPPAAA